MNHIEKVFKGAIYVRLSKEDGDSFLLGKNESDSITNQKLLIMNHLKKMPEIEVAEIFEDDGFTGTNFERPGFQKLIEAIKERRIDCVVCKPRYPAPCRFFHTGRSVPPGQGASARRSANSSGEAR